MIQFDEVKIRASYLNFFMVKLYAKEGRMRFEKEHEYEGNKPGTVVYKIKGSNHFEEIAPKWYDIYYLLNTNEAENHRYLSLLIEEEQLKAKNPNGNIEELDEIRDNLRVECQQYVENNQLTDNSNIVTLTSTDEDETGRLSIHTISHKGSILLEMAQKCYSVPDFCIVTSRTYNVSTEERRIYLQQAVRNLEIMTRRKLGSDENPLVFAIRSALPQYIPGLMPTLLNIGVTHKAYIGLIKKLGERTANRIYLNNLRNIVELKEINTNIVNETFKGKDNELTTQQQLDKIKILEELILKDEDGDKLINDAFYQVEYTANSIKAFYEKNQDLIQTFMQGKQAYPSLIMQKMVWTIGNENSYPGVIHSFHSRTGNGRQVESYVDIFGEEIMTGDVTSNDMEYFDRIEIKDQYPAIYHFDPLLRKLEKHYQSPVTIEFAVETRNHVSMFAVLQLNKSELTGRSTLVSTIKLRQEGVIKDEKVVELIRPYHLRQILSDTIDESSFLELQYFGKGVNVLPRTAVTARICFNTQEAREFKRDGTAVCLCKERFIPEDTIILNEIDAILSMTPAAIHVVTACRGYGIPAFLNLQSYGIKLENDKLINNDNIVINNGDWITLSSKRQSIYIGKAKYTPARFTKYYNGEKIEMAEKERKVFDQMKEAYAEYNKIVTSISADYIHDLNSLARIIRNDLKDSPEKAATIVNEWYSHNSEKYIQQVLESKMGSHQDQARVYDILDVKKKIDFYQRAIKRCKKDNLSGLNAGAFMLGRFASKPLPEAFWKSMTTEEIAFILNEYVLYEKYLYVLEEVGETKLTRVHSKIANEGFNFHISINDIYNFKSLVTSKVDWNKIIDEIKNMQGELKSRLELADKLSQPMEVIFDKAWKK